MTTVMPCPFCEYDDVYISEIEPGRLAVDCPNCESIGPFADTVEDAARLWNVVHDKSLKLDRLTREAKEVSAGTTAG